MKLPVSRAIWGLAALLLLFPGYGTAQAANKLGQKIYWTPPQISLTLTLGSSESLAVPFTTDEELRDLTVWISPSLEQILKTDVVSIPLILEHHSFELSLDFELPTNVAQKSFSGTVHLRGPNGKTYSTPLAVHLNIDRMPEETLSTLASDLSQGDLEGALGTLGDSGLNRTVIESMSADLRRVLAQSFKDARLLSASNVYRVYEMPGPMSGITVKFSMALLDSTGKWVIVSW